jgi:hypothetical protein
MARITSQQIRQLMVTSDSSLDPNFPPEKLAVFDGQGNILDLSDIALRLRISVLSAWKGEWLADQAYDEGSLVRYNSSLYLATNNVAANGATPDAEGDTLWAFLAGGGNPNVEDPNAMHFRGAWFNNAPYVWGDVVIDEGGLYILNSVDELPAFSTAPSAETDPDTANWMKIANTT